LPHNDEKTRPHFDEDSANLQVETTPSATQIESLQVVAVVMMMLLLRGNSRCLAVAGVFWSG
jgi:hypothetical protein